MPSLKHTPSSRGRVSESLKPSRAFARWWYRLYGWTSPPERSLPPPVLEMNASKDEAFKRISFTFSVIALSARIACADGKLTREKYAAFREAFPLSGGICGKIRALFSLACENQTSYERYVNQIKAAFPQQMALFTSLVDRLFSIATANGELPRETEYLLARVGHMLGLSPQDYSAIRDRYTGPKKAHHVLGVGKRTRADRLRQRYRELMRTWHPDRFATEDLSPEVELLLRLKASEINAAYHAMSRRAA